MRGTPVLLIPLLLQAACGGLCTTKPCPGTTLRLVLPWSILKSQQGQIRACIGDRCSAAPVWSPPAGAGDLGRWVGAFSGPLSASGWLTAQPTVAGAEPRYELGVLLTLDGAQAADGDRYTITVTDPASGETAAQAWTASYFDARPNGDGCEPLCRAPRLTAQP